MTTPESPVLVPCPFCGSDNLSPYSAYVSCINCGVTGPISKLECIGASPEQVRADAIAKWNQRPHGVELWRVDYRYKNGNASARHFRDKTNCEEYCDWLAGMGLTVVSVRLFVESPTPRPGA